MLLDPRIEKFADVLVNYSTKVEKGDRVYISGSVLAKPLIETLYKKVLQLGAHPSVSISLDGLTDLYYEYASDEELKRTDDIKKFIYEKFDVLIILISEYNTRSLSNVSSEKIALVTKAGKTNSEIVMKRSAKWSNDPSYKEGQLRWVVSLFPTNISAVEADMSLTDYENFVFKSVGVLEKDPVAFWQNFSKKQKVICEMLNTKKRLSFRSPNCNIEFNVEGRTWINCDGRLNMPDGEVFTGPVENDVTGWINFTYPTLYDGHEVNGVRIQMEKGKCVSSTANKGEEFLNSKLDTDEGCRRIGELAIATNPFITAFSKEILFDEKIGGTFHVAFGHGYPESGSKNKDAAIHWDMICDMKDGTVEDENKNIIYKNGEFLL